MQDLKLLPFFWLYITKHPPLPLLHILQFTIIDLIFASANSLCSQRSTLRNPKRECFLLGPSVLASTIVVLKSGKRMISSLEINLEALL